ncbi:putative cell division cycle 45 (CDC45) [Leptomonas pyrrhocoris]|uniref:Putative cell division cycle 45 (CDC45) n=1 Tax=Leptomonas pyrrhocoris TaxID=157538 RepID=A0A0M9G2U1_LEPPY|nr:putative cell division cycle 45 (CDC45) [Leptomonas pyrrhocoris]XP_015659517.1 putative cell division cycle 45 (CDC45) [Leptomonas pyrrhocoris]KPA81077.1 putative cell division cycle 45 (CDC45) [Leptomonas pyrrhocoris]KPA81078.1 putative cell division cycle 45 (CDC45) [Leptomonas pyrrhocoris]|eukprot:XP_015659516.1 putative cell division cycle 45 (CDC45) [Leptomonas pyrrhocoris]
MSERTGAPEPWERISTYYFSTLKAVNVLVAPTADAAAASLSLTYLLKVFLFPFKLHPTGSYDDVRRFIGQTNFAQESEREDEDSPLVDDLFILVGLGAPVALGEYFDFSRHVVIVVDAYRPFHLDNLRREDGERLIVWGSERIQEEVDTFFRTQRAAEAQRRRRHRRRHAMKAARESRRQHPRSPPRPHRRPRREAARVADDVDGGEEEEDSNDGVDSDVGHDRNEEYDEESELSDSSSNSSSSDDEDAEAELFDGDGDDATPSQSQDRIDWRAEDGEVPPHLQTLYYACACAGRSSAVEMYDLSVILHRFNDSILWHAAVGVCDLYLRRLIDYGSYLVEMAPLQEAVSLQQSVRRGVLRDRTDEAVNQVRQATTNSMQLNNREEEQLYLLRHSSLWDAIWYDAQVASALDLHHVEDGRPRLSQLLASRCGVSMAMARRPWREVPADVGSEALRRVQTELQNWVNARGNATSYRNKIRCISRKVGYSTEVSAFDVCKLFTAVLAAVPPASVYVVEKPRDSSTGSFSAEDVAAVAQRQLVEFGRGQFWRAHALLDMDPNEKPFHEALAEALSLQQAVADATSSMMQPGNVQSSTGLHYALPTDPSKTSPTLEGFCTPRRLSVLAERLFYTLTMSRRRDRQALTTLRPLVLSCALPQAKLAPPLQREWRRWVGGRRHCQRERGRRGLPRFCGGHPFNHDQRDRDGCRDAGRGQGRVRRRADLRRRHQRRDGAAAADVPLSAVHARRALQHRAASGLRGAQRGAGARPREHHLPGRAHAAAVGEGDHFESRVPQESGGDGGGGGGGRRRGRRERRRWRCCGRFCRGARLSGHVACERYSICLSPS